MGTKLSVLRRRVREELRAEGPDGAGYSDFMIDQHINSALQALSEVYTIRDEISLNIPNNEWAQTTAYTIGDVIYNSSDWYYCTANHTSSEDSEPGEGDDWGDYWRKATWQESNRFSLDDYIDISLLDSIIQLTYDGYEIDYIGPRELALALVNEGKVRNWTLWGDDLILVGEVEPDDEVTMWIIRMPQIVVEDEDEVELPHYTDEAITQYAVAGCYRESRDYERADRHYTLFLRQERRLRSRSIPQGQRARSTIMQSTYTPALREHTVRRSDTNPGGRPQ